MSLYMLGGTGPGYADGSSRYLHVGIESGHDVHLRNAMILSSVPNVEQQISKRKHTIYFSSLKSLVQSITSYDSFRCRWYPEQFVDYTRLKHRCRAMFLQETVTKTLVVRGGVSVIDLTEEVRGSFRNVYRLQKY
jgi:hypothetical protein